MGETSEKPHHNGNGARTGRMLTQVGSAAGTGLIALLAFVTQRIEDNARDVTALQTEIRHLMTPDGRILPSPELLSEVRGLRDELREMKAGSEMCREHDKLLGLEFKVQQIETKLEVR